MDCLRRVMSGTLLAIMLFGSTGCALFHELQLHRLHRWNRSDPMGSGADAYFSVNDPVPEEVDLELTVRE